MEKCKVLFICKDNSVRSQMAAAFLNTYFGDRYEAHSAATGEPLGINPYAAKVMKEIGIDLSSCRVKSIEELHGTKFDCIITLCESARISQSSFPEHKKFLHKSFRDYCIPMYCDAVKKTGPCFPQDGGRHHKGRKGLAENPKSEEEILYAFRNLREEIFEWVEKEAVF